MRLTFYSDYSPRLLMYAAIRHGELGAIQEVADAYGISKNHLMKVAFELGRKGHLNTVRGRSGAFRLSRDPDRISLGAVIQEAEEDFTMVECFDPKASKCAITVSCRLRGALSRALKAYFAVLDEYTLADLTVKHPVLERLLLNA